MTDHQFLPLLRRIAISNKPIRRTDFPSRQPTATSAADATTEEHTESLPSAEVNNWACCWTPGWTSCYCTLSCEKLEFLQSSHFRCDLRYVFRQILTIVFLVSKNGSEDGGNWEGFSTAE